MRVPHIKAIQDIEGRAAIAIDPERIDHIDRLAERPAGANIVTIADLIERIRRRGQRWWTTVPKLGEKGAQRIVEWLRGYEASVGPLPSYACAPARHKPSAEVVPSRASRIQAGNDCRGDVPVAAALHLPLSFLPSLRLAAFRLLHRGRRHAAHQPKSSLCEPSRANLRVSASDLR
ncbi:MAG: phage integrase family protein [Halothiobacillaceae bacterium]